MVSEPFGVTSPVVSGSNSPPVSGPPSRPAREFGYSVPTSRTIKRSDRELDAIAFPVVTTERHVTVSAASKSKREDIWTEKLDEFFEDDLNWLLDGPFEDSTLEATGLSELQPLTGILNGLHVAVKNRKNMQVHCD